MQRKRTFIGGTVQWGRYSEPVGVRERALVMFTNSRIRPHFAEQRIVSRFGPAVLDARSASRHQITGFINTGFEERGA